MSQLSHSFAISTNKIKTNNPGGGYDHSGFHQTKQNIFIALGRGPHQKRKILLAWIFLGVFLGLESDDLKQRAGVFEGDSGGHTWMGLDEEHLRFHPRV